MLKPQIGFPFIIVPLGISMALETELHIDTNMLNL